MITVILRYSKLYCAHCGALTGLTVAQVKHILVHEAYNHDFEVTTRPLGGAPVDTVSTAQYALAQGSREIALLCHAAKCVRQLVPKVGRKQALDALNGLEVRARGSSFQSIGCPLSRVEPKVTPEKVICWSPHSRVLAVPYPE